jgi:hypothetical protein
MGKIFIREGREGAPESFVVDCTHAARFDLPETLVLDLLRVPSRPSRTKKVSE